MDYQYIDIFFINIDMFHNYHYIYFIDTGEIV